MFKGLKVLKSKPRIFFFCILGAIIIGISSAAILNSKIQFFFYCTFLGSAVAGFSCLGFLVCTERRFKFKVTDSTEGSLSKVLAIAVATSITFSFLSTIPLNIDRSFSVWMLNRISADKTLSSQEKIEKEAELFFSAESGEILRRVNEQLQLGNIERVNGLITLTGKGNFQVKFHNFIQGVFHLNDKYAG